MTRPTLAELATRAGLLVDWRDAAGKPMRVSPDTLRLVLDRMGLPCGGMRQIAESCDCLAVEAAEARARFITAVAGKPISLPQALPARGRARLTLEDGTTRDLRITAAGGGRIAGIAEPGYHRLAAGGTETMIAVAPPRALGVADFAGKRRVWGLAAQLYGLRRREDRAFGDFGALADLVDAAAARGADAVAISPVHALFAADPGRYSPYAPSSRMFLNVLYADPGLALGTRALKMLAVPESPAAKLAQRDLIAWPEAGREKIAWLARLHAAFLAKAPAALRKDFAAFRAEGGALLEEHARFEALHARFLAERGAGGWQGWPREFRDPHGEAVAAFAAKHETEVGRHAFLQWLAHRSLGAVQRRSEAAGMTIGLIADLAIGTHGDGSHAWSRRDDLLTGLNVGAPPDLFNRTGQDWGLMAFSPLALAREGFAPFLATLRAALRHAGGIRIDHVLGLARLWLVPHGAEAKHGAYLTYPLDDYLRLLALESHRHKALVVGEDLGTVPEGFRARLSKAGILGMNVLPFERDESGGFISSRRWPEDRLAMTTTHDLPTVAGWWTGRDIAVAQQLGKEKPTGAARRRKERAADRAKLWAACVKAKTAQGPMPPADQPAPAVDAAIGFVAAARCALAIVAMEDVLGLEEQPNLPGTIDEHPNWRRRLPADSPTLLRRPEVGRRLDILRRRRKERP